MSRLTARRLNRATLARQLLLERHRVDPAEGVRRVVALQAQEPASPYVALHARLEGFDPGRLDRAFEQFTIVKASLMRITLHVVTAEDYSLFHTAMTDSLRAARLNDRRFRGMDLTIEQADELVSPLLAFLAQPRSKAEVEEHLTEQVGPQPAPGPWWALRTYAPLAHSPTGPPWSFNHRPMYRAAPSGASTSGDEGVRHLVRRYLEGFGPARPQDIRQFSLLPMSTITPALAAMQAETVEFEGPGGDVLHDVPAAPLPSEDVPAPPRLLPMWDSVLLAYHDRSRVIPERFRPIVIRSNGDVLPTVLIDGYVAGVWRPLHGGIEVSLFEKATRSVWKGLEEDAAHMNELIRERDPETYGRYRRWFADLPAAETRVVD